MTLFYNEKSPTLLDQFKVLRFTVDSPSTGQTAPYSGTFRLGGIGLSGLTLTEAIALTDVRLKMSVGICGRGPSSDV